MTEPRIIPRHKPEVIAAAARHYASGDEKVATAALNPAARRRRPRWTTTIPRHRVRQS
jgi:hypothetical protein